FEEKKYDINQYALIDSGQLLVDFTSALTKQTSCEYQIIDRLSLLNIYFHYQSKLYSYTAKDDTDILTIVERLIADNSTLTTTAFCLIDTLRQIIDCRSIGEIYRIKNDTVDIEIMDVTAESL
ncbi:unnamed protein product, partial [Didymodactylos carnosus]